MRRIGTVLPVGLVALAAPALLLATSAGAGTAAPAGVAAGHDDASLVDTPDEPRSWDCHESWEPSRVCFAEWGEWFMVDDLVPDGHSAVAEWVARRPDGTLAGSGYVWHSYGAAEPYASWDSDLHEGWNVAFRACVGESAERVIVSCDDSWQTTLA